MSRRRSKPPQEIMEANADRATVEIGCTGRGTHRRIVIGSFYVRGQLEASVGLIASNKDLHHFTDGEDYAFVQPKRAPEAYFNYSTAMHKTYPFKCKSCGRDLPQGQFRLWRLLRILKAQGSYFLDLSSLDAIS